MSATTALTGPSSFAPHKAEHPSIEQIMRNALARRRFALMGFETAEANSIIDVLASVGGQGHVVSIATNIPGLNSFSHFDACIINASAGVTAEHISPIEMIARSRKPAVIVGTRDELERHLVSIANLNRDFAARPYAPEELLLRAYRILRFAHTTEETIAASTRNGKRRAVVADDDAATVILISTILRHAHFDCDVARDGAEAVAVAREKTPDVVLLDISMPQGDGFETLKTLRSDPATREIPVVMVTSHRDEDQVVKAFSFGADDYVSKPFHSGELMARVNRIIRQSEES